MSVQGEKGDWRGTQESILIEAPGEEFGFYSGCNREPLKSLKGKS